MKLNDMKNKTTGLPQGFEGVRMKWNEVKGTFEIEKAAILERDKTNDAGEIIRYEKGPKAGQAVPDRQLALQIRTEDGTKVIVRTNSPRLTSLYTGELDREPDSSNQFGDRIFFVDVPEGKLRFVPHQIEGKDKTGKVQKWDVADLEQVD